MCSFRIEKILSLTRNPQIRTGIGRKDQAGSCLQRTFTIKQAKSALFKQVWLTCFNMLSSMLEVHFSCFSETCSTNPLVVFFTYEIEEP